ncbi:MAG: sigma-70 family RNA polymerase sigma factor [Xanthomonadaceae bacterium]|nr:sigma-70 family RNA polymerase sigma factor [Xanthomonadaceae bacterium]MDP2186895.1 sigma-70 family RNA polymerase sigma factor [Xanthomonadales bacterium]MDZ4117454.1 sigma-70 family RNA polymerase sigma factor [Xanthomonadaceae bacterium]MDZ4378292.1 sigma-70 family RNA polymerase sigma factor [Xanthomonadaceae bacterium]
MIQPSTFAIDLPDAIVKRARDGHADAFEQIYRRFERPVYTVALRLLGDREEAQDALHDTMLRLFERIGSFRGESPFWAWLRQIAVNEALMRLRRRGTVNYSDEPPEPEMDAGEQLLPPAAADHALLLRALEQLPANTRSVIWLYHVEGYTHEEIAQAMERSLSFSKSQLARGTRRLRALLQEPDHVIPVEEERRHA